jgi:hypothetical protein
MTIVNLRRFYVYVWDDQERWIRLATIGIGREQVRTQTRTALAKHMHVKRVGVLTEEEVNYFSPPAAHRAEPGGALRAP